MPETMAMFPLGTVLFPGMGLPLHVFEPRYRALVDHCLDEAAEPEFGVVLIERGSEVGGGDVRTGIGTVARIVEATRFDDGRWAIGAVGVRRVRVVRWLGEDPFPRAEVEEWPDADGLASSDDVTGLATTFRRVLALASELGIAVPPLDLELHPDPAVAIVQMAVGAPLGPVDRQALLAAPGPVERLAALTTMLDEQVEMLRGQVAMGDPGPEPGRGYGEGGGGL